MTDVGQQQPGPVPVMELHRSPAGHRTVTTLVVGFDRSEASRAALAKAAEIGAMLGADLRVVHAVDLADYPVDPDADDWEQQAAQSVEEERRRVAESLAGYPGAWSLLVVRADPAEALDRVARRCDALMIVVGVRSHGWRHVIERLTGPAVSNRLIGHCARPVLVVGPPPPG